MSVSRLLWTTVVALVAFNVARGLGLLGPASDWIELVLAVVLAGVALRGTLSLGDLGLERQRTRSGLLWGGAVFGIVLVVVLAAALIPATSDFLRDDRANVSAGELFVELVVGIGLLTVIPEELLFRGVLLGTSMKQWGVRAGIAFSSVLFGLWHVFPTLSTAGGNEQFAQAETSTLGQIGLVIGAVITTGIAGVVFSWLRVRSGSLLAPMIAHLSTNGVALTVAWIVAF